MWTWPGTLKLGTLLSVLCVAACGSPGSGAALDPMSQRHGCRELAYDPSRGPNWFNLSRVDSRQVRIDTRWRATLGQRFALVYVPIEEEGRPYAGPSHAEARVVSIAQDEAGFAAIAQSEQETSFVPTEAFGPVDEGDVIADAHLEYEASGERRLDSPLGRPEVDTRHVVGPYTAHESWVQKRGGAWVEVEAKVMRFRAGP